MAGSVKGESKFSSSARNPLPKPPPVKLLRSLFFAKSKSLPRVRFEEQQLSSFTGLIVLIPLFKRLRLDRRLEDCFVSLAKHTHAHSFGPFFKGHPGFSCSFYLTRLWILLQHEKHCLKSRQWKLSQRCYSIRFAHYQTLIPSLSFIIHFSSS